MFIQSTLLRASGSPGSEARLEDLYRIYGPTVHARCRRILRDEQAAEDATQEIFLRVYRHIDRVPDAVGALRWIYRVATNYCLNQIRDTQRRQALGAQWRYMAPDVLPAFAGVDLRDLILEIPETLRSVAWLYHVDGMRQQEIADVLGISCRTVVSRLSDFDRRARLVLDEARPCERAS